MNVEQVRSSARWGRRKREGADGQPAFLPDGRIVYTAFTAEGTELRWLDPEAPEETFAVPVELEWPENPAAVRP